MKEKMIKNCDCVSVKCLIEVFSDSCEGLISQMEYAKDRKQMLYANDQIDGIIEVLENLKKYQYGNKWMREDEDFSSFDIDSIIKNAVAERAKMFEKRSKYFDEVEEWGGLLQYRWAMATLQERKEKREAQEASK